MTGLFPTRATLARLYLTLRHRVFGRRFRRLVLEQVDGVSLVVLPDVFNPVLFRTGTFLAQTLHKSPLSSHRRAPSALSASLRGSSTSLQGGFARDRGEGDIGFALDLGTGSGIGAIFAARLGYRVVGVDINPEAVRCARLNALLNHVEDRVEVRHGDLFAPVADERFDLILFNPPFYRGTPQDAFDHAWRATDVMERFAAGLRGALRPGGRALMVLSTQGDGQALLRELQRNDFAVEPVARRDFGNEVLSVYSASVAR